MTSSVFIISEIGESKEFSSYKQLSKLYSNYLLQLGISNIETYVISSTGEKVLIETLIKQNTIINNKINYFIYSQVNHYDLFQKFLIEDIINKRYSITLRSPSSLFIEDSLDSKSLSNIESLLNDISFYESSYDTIISLHSIEGTYKQIINTYNSYININSKLTSIINQIIKIKENKGVMINANDKLWEHYAYITNQMHSIKASINHKENIISQRIKDSDKTYRQFLEIKSKELQKSLSYTQNEFFELCFDEAKAKNLKTNFVKHFLYIQGKIKEKEQKLMDEIKKVHQDNIRCSTKINQRDIDFINRTYNSIVTEKGKYKKEKIYNDLIQFQNLCQSVYNEYHDDNDKNKAKSITVVIKTALNNIKVLKDKYEGLYPLPDIFDQAQDKSEQIKELMTKFIMKNSQLTSYIFASIKVFMILQEKFKSYDKCLGLIEMTINDFDNLINGASQYNQYCQEIRQRLSINQSITQSLIHLKESLNIENKRRSEFNQLNHDGFMQFINKNHNSNNNDSSKSLINDELKLFYEFTNDTEKYPRLLSNNHQENNDVLIPKAYNLNNNSTMILNLEQKIKEKEKQINHFMSKLKKKNEDISNYQSEKEKMSKAIEILSENFSLQIKELQEVIKEKDTQIEKLSKIVNDNTYGSFLNCPMCKEAAMNTVDYQVSSVFIKDQNNKIDKRAKEYYKLQSKYIDMVNQIFTIKRTFFNHLNQVMSIKNEEIHNEREYYENALMHLEDLFAQHLDLKSGIKKFHYAKGSIGVFIPATNGLYTGMQFSKNNNNNNHDDRSVYVLDIERLHDRIKELIVDQSFIIIGRIGSITHEKKQSSVYHVCLDEIYHILSLNNEEKVIRNYINDQFIDSTMFLQENSIPSLK